MRVSALVDQRKAGGLILLGLSALLLGTTNVASAKVGRGGSSGPSATLSYKGLNGDQLGADMSVTPDGTPDEHFRVTLTMDRPRTITGMGWRLATSRTSGIRPGLEASINRSRSCRAPRASIRKTRG